ncbi:MAG: hypothetical protein AABX32_03360 [Nanoarchaeota archaeon]
MNIIAIIGIILLSSIFTINTAFGEATYGLLENKFQNQPLVCIYASDTPKATQIIKDLWMKDTELGIKNWEYELQSTSYINKGQWHIEIQKIPVENQLSFDNKNCDVEVQFTDQQIDYENIAAGWYWFDGTRGQIRLLYLDLEVCNVRTEGIYRITEWCYKEDLVRSKALGNIATHEFGHAIGLDHYLSDNPQENYDWSTDPYASPSVMTIAVHYDEEKHKIRKLDVNRVMDIYGANGFGKAKQITIQEFLTPEEKNIGGFESFFTSQPEYVKKKGTVDFVTISGKVTEDVFSKGQNVLIKIVFPDGHDEELKALATNNRQFSIQIRVDDTIQTGVYTLEAKYMNNDSEKLSFAVLDGTSNKIEPKAEIAIPNWIRNNAKWWADGTIADRDFVMGIQFLAQQKIIKVGQTTESSTSTQDIPQWIRNNAKWWADGMITDADFVKGIQFLAQQGIIKVN